LDGVEAGNAITATFRYVRLAKVSGFFGGGNLTFVWSYIQVYHPED
jgi:hypothetical protein